MKNRLDKTAEFFTPDYLSNKILDKVEVYAPLLLNDPTKNTLEPCCGNGEILLEILKRKHALGMTKEEAIFSTYAFDLMVDNIADVIARIAFWYHYNLDLDTSHDNHDPKHDIYWLLESDYNNYNKLYFSNTYEVCVYQSLDKKWLFEYATKGRRTIDFSQNYIIADIISYDLSFDGSEP